MSSVHAQVYVRDGVLRVESRLPRRFTAEGLTLEIAAVTHRRRLVGELCSIRHEGRWRLGSSTGSAVVDLVPAGSDLTELIVQTDDDRWTRRRPEARRVILRSFVLELRRAILAERRVVQPSRDESRTTHPWRTPA